MSETLPQASPSIHAPRRTIHTPGSREAYAPERPSWGPPKAGAVRTWAQFLFLNSELRGDAVGAFARQARADRDFPADATVVLRYLASQLAPAEVLEVACKTVDEFRAWHAEGLERALTDVGHVQPERAVEVRESLRLSLEALDRLYLEDQAVLRPWEGAS